MKLLAIISLALTSYFLQGCVFVPERNGPRYYPEERVVVHERYGHPEYHGRHW